MEILEASSPLRVLVALLRDLCVYVVLQKWKYLMVVFPCVSAAITASTVQRRVFTNCCHKVGGTLQHYISPSFELRGLDQP